MLQPQDRRQVEMTRDDIVKQTTSRRTKLRDGIALSFAIVIQKLATSRTQRDYGKKLT
jgi:hypothetical protein